MTEALPHFLDPINTLPRIRAGWAGRISGLDVDGERDFAMRALRPRHEAFIAAFSPAATLWRAEQVHGSAVALVPGPPVVIAPDGLPVVPGVDGLVTATPGVTLAIYVADCGPIWLADPETGAIGLLHSGKKGTEANILAAALDLMTREFGSRPENVTAVLGPCIRPPHYEIDFAADITRQAEAAGLTNFHDPGENTAADLARHYSYRMEKGRTGRMLALITRTA